MGYAEQREWFARGLSLGLGAAEIILRRAPHPALAAYEMLKRADEIDRRLDRAVDVETGAAFDHGGGI